MRYLVPRRHIRVHVEPVEVELDDAEGSLLFASLQSAFPSCSGLYYRSGANGSTCRTAVKFDGQKFHAPQGDWENRDYYVTLGGRCSFPFGSYENASKQFERSVNMVQKMMGSVGYKKAKVDDYIIAASPPKTPPSPHERVDTIKDLLKTLATKQSTPTEHHEKENISKRTSITSSSLSPLEQQFADLARIAAGKDAIIESQRNELKTLNDKVDELRKQIEKASEEIVEYQLKNKAQEEELTDLRAFGKEQINMCQQVKELTQQLIESREYHDRTTRDLESKLNEDRETIDMLRQTINDQADNIAKLKRSLAESQHQCSSLQELLRQAEDRLNQHIEQARQELAEAKKVEEDLTSDNGRLFERNTELELERDRLDKRCQELDDLWRQRIDAAIKEESNRNATLEEEVESQRQRVTELSSLVDQMARDNAEAVRRLEEIRMERDELRRSTALLETKVHTVGSISRMNGTPLRF